MWAHNLESSLTVVFTYLFKTDLETRLKLLKDYEAKKLLFSRPSELHLAPKYPDEQNKS